MSTVNLNIYTNPYPTVANYVEIRLYLQSADTAVVTSLRHPFPHNVADTWSFPGLAIANYLFRIFEVDGSGNIIQELGSRMDVVPSAAGGVNSRDTEQIEADVTVGFVSGVNSVTFDGTAGAEDWRTWEIDTIDRMGTGPMKKGIDYSWNKTTGTLLLLNTGDVFNPNEWFNVQFAIQTNVVAASVPTTVPQFSTPKLITANYTADAGIDFGGLLIVDPASNYLELTLPDLTTVVPGKLLSIEMRRAGGIKCCKILTAAGQTIDWLQGTRNNLYVLPQESLSIYRFIDPGGSATGMWRVFNPFGNWLRVGEQVTDDNAAANVFNKILLDDTTYDILQFARFYNDFVTLLPGGEFVNFDDWATGNNKYKYSLANSAIPANAGLFHVPDRRNLFERITDGTRLPGDFAPPALLSHNHRNGVADDKPSGDSTNVFVYGQTNLDIPGAAKGNIAQAGGNTLFQGLTQTVGGGENCPANIAIRKYLYV